GRLKLTVQRLRFFLRDRPEGGPTPLQTRLSRSSSRFGARRHRYDLRQLRKCEYIRMSMISNEPQGGTFYLCFPAWPSTCSCRTVCTVRSGSTTSPSLPSRS